MLDGGMGYLDGDRELLDGGRGLLNGGRRLLDGGGGLLHLAQAKELLDFYTVLRHKGFLCSFLFFAAALASFLSNLFAMVKCKFTYVET